MNITNLKNMHIETDVGAGSGVAIVAPVDDRYEGSIKLVQEALERNTGNRAELIREQRDANPLPAPALPAIPDDCRTIILIGTLTDSPSFCDLYRRRYACADLLYPGTGQGELRTVHNPCGDGRNWIVVSGSDLSGVNESAGRLSEHIEKGHKLPHIIEAQTDLVSMDVPEDLDSIVSASVEDILLNGRPSAAIDPIFGCGYMYHLTGRREWAEAWRNGVYTYADTIIGETDSKPTGRAEFWTWQMIHQWDLLEESDVFDDAQRLELTNRMFVLADRASKISYMLLENLPVGEVRWNHQTFNAIGCLVGGLYFSKYYNPPEAQMWLHQARMCFDGMRGTVRSWDEAGGYGSLTPLHLLIYGLFDSNQEYLEAVDLEGMAERSFVNHDPMGALVNHGDGGGWSKNRMVPGIGYSAQYWEGTATLFGDGRYKWMIDKVEGVRRPYANSAEDLIRLSREFTSPPFAVPIEPAQPIDHIGTYVFSPLDKKVYIADFAHISDEPAVSHEETVDKIAFREGLNETDAYLLWDGFGGGRHGHMDSNAIVRLSDNGRVWLADGGYNSESTARYHNGLLVIRDGELEPMPPLCRLDAIAELDTTSSGILTLPDYGGVDWTRCILRKKNAYFLILDAAHAKTPGTYDIRLSWRYLGRAKRVSEGLRITQTDAEAIHFTNQPEGILRDEERYFVGRFPVWDGYPYADPVVRHYEQRQISTINDADKAGHRTRWCSAIATSQSPMSDNYSVTENAYGFVVQTPDSRALCGIDSLKGKDISIAAAAYHLEEHGPWSIISGTDLRFGALRITANAPVSMEIDWNSGSLTVRVSSSVDIDFEGCTVADRMTSIHLSEGLHTLALKIAGVTEPILREGIRSDLFESSAVSSERKKNDPAAAPGELKPESDLAIGGVPQSVTCTTEFIACGTSDGTLHVIGESGDRWSASLGGKINAIATVTPPGSQAPLIVTAHENRMVHCHTATGDVVWSYQCPNGELSTVGRARLLRIADLDGDGADEILVGTTSWWVICLGTDGVERWRTRCYAHSVLSLEMGLLDSEGHSYIVQSNEYYYFHVLATDGELVASHYVDRWSPQVFPIVTVDLDGDGRDEIVTGGSDGIIRAFHLVDAAGESRGQSVSQSLEELWNVRTGGEVTSMALIAGSNEAGNGRDMIVAASEGYLLTAIDTFGKRCWEIDIAFPAERIYVTDVGILSMGGDKIVATSTDGRQRRDFATPDTIVSSTLTDAYLILGVGNGHIYRYSIQSLF